MSTQAQRTPEVAQNKAEIASRARKRRKESRQAAEMEISATAKYLQDHLGQALVSILADVADPKTVGRWARGRVSPSFKREVRLRVAYDATKLIVESLGESTARAWFLGSSPYLDDESPAIVLSESKTFREGRQIMPAARSFLEGAY